MSLEDEHQFIRGQVDEKKIQEHLKRSFDLENTLKNVVVGKLRDIREIKNRRSLKDSVQEIIRIRN